MSITEILILLAMSVYAVYRQSIRHRVSHGPARFKLALIYAIVGIAVGGFYLPPDNASWLYLLGSLLASAVVGVLRGRWTRLWREADGTVYSQGTAVTILLFVLLVGGKFAVGTWLYLHHAHPHGGFGEILLMIALMVAMQAEIIRRRVQVLLAEQGGPGTNGQELAHADHGR